jgi:hypothetical protein
MPQRPCAGALAGASDAATALCVAVGVAPCFTGSRAATTGRAAGLPAGASLEVKGSSHLPPPPRRAGALAGFGASTGGAARRVPVDLRFGSENGSSQSPDDRLAFAAAVFLRGAGGAKSSSSATRFAATCLPPLRGDGS